MHLPSAVGALALVLVVVPARADDAAPIEVSRARTDMDIAVATMRGRAKWVQDRLRVARRRGAGAEVACLDEALSRADVAVRRAREEEEAALAAYALGDVASARLARRHVVELAKAQSFVARDALACSAVRMELAAGGTRVTIDVDPRIPRVD